MPNEAFQFTDEIMAFIKLMIFFGLVLVSFLLMKRFNVRLISKNQRRIRELLLSVGLLIGLFYILDFTFLSHQVAVALFLLFFIGSLFSLIKNSFYGLFIFLKNTISIDDFIEINGVKGVVYKIQFATTIIFTSDSAYVHIPNGDFFKSIYTKESTKEEQHSAFLQFDLVFTSKDMEHVLRISKDAIRSSIYTDVSQSLEVTVNQQKSDHDKILIHFKLHILNASFNEKIKSDLLIRINKELEKIES